MAVRERLVILMGGGIESDVSCGKHPNGKRVQLSNCLMFEEIIWFEACNRLRLLKVLLFKSGSGLVLSLSLSRREESYYARTGRKRVNNRANKPSVQHTH